MFELEGLKLETYPYSELGYRAHAGDFVDGNSEHYISTDPSLIMVVWAF